MIQCENILSEFENVIKNEFITRRESSDYECVIEYFNWFIYEFGSADIALLITWADVRFIIYRAEQYRDIAIESIDQMQIRLRRMFAFFLQHLI